MNSFFDNIKSKGWDKFFLDTENEFKHIREELAIATSTSTAKVIVSGSNSSHSESELHNFLIHIKDETDVKKEFKKLREDLNINAFQL